MQRVAIKQLLRLLKFEHMLYDNQLAYCRSALEQAKTHKRLRDNEVYLIGIIFEEVHSGKEK